VDLLQSYAREAAQISPNILQKAIDV
jgi:hypothetical protein